MQAINWLNQHSVFQWLPSHPAFRAGRYNEQRSAQGLNKDRGEDRNFQWAPPPPQPLLLLTCFSPELSMSGTLVPVPVHSFKLNILWNFWLETESERERGEEGEGERERAQSKNLSQCYSQKDSDLKSNELWFELNVTIFLVHKWFATSTTD